MFCEFSEDGVTIYIKALLEMIFKMVELVEIGVRKKMRNTNGVINQDGW